MHYEITLADTDAVAIGAGILGTGGGGNTYIGRTWLRKELRERGTVCRIIAADDVADDAYVCAIGTMGAPTVGIEKLQNGQEFITAMRAIEAHLRAPLAAILIGEIGGSNALKPLICGLQMNLPVVDGDGMGRAFPELQMDTFAIGGVSLTPMALADFAGNVVIFDKMDTPLRVEQYARSLTIEMGGSAALAMPLMTGRQMKQHIIRRTLTLARQIGETVLDARPRPFRHACPQRTENTGCPRCGWAGRLWLRCALPVAAREFVVNFRTRMNADLRGLLFIRAIRVHPRPMLLIERISLLIELRNGFLWLPIPNSPFL